MRQTGRRQPATIVQDKDGDEFTAADDCDDTDADQPSASEICDGLDNNCNDE